VVLALGQELAALVLGRDGAGADVRLLARLFFGDFGISGGRRRIEVAGQRIQMPFQAVGLIFAPRVGGFVLAQGGLAGLGQGRGSLDGFEIASGVDAHHAALHVTNCLFTGTGQAIGGAANGNGINVVDSTFANIGDGIYGGAAITAVGTYFRNSGEAMFIYSCLNIRATSCQFFNTQVNVHEGRAIIDSSSFWGTAGIVVGEGDATVSNSNFDMPQNKAIQLCPNICGATVTNCTFGTSP